MARGERLDADELDRHITGNYGEDSVGPEPPDLEPSGFMYWDVCHDTITIERARYNHLLEVERNAQEFVESFTRWEA